jgi:hypothetical protein
MASGGQSNRLHVLSGYSWKDGKKMVKILYDYFQRKIQVNWR